PAAFVQTLSTGILTPVLFLFIARINLDPLALALTIAVGVAFALPALWLGGKIADTQNPRYALIPGLLTAALGFFLIGYLPLRLGLSPYSLGLPAMLIGAGFGLFFPGWNGLVVKSLPDTDRAAAWGGIMTVEALGYAVGPTLGGLAWDLFGPVGPFALGAALMLLVGGYYLWQLFGSR
ncbi:MAG TPA: MFS transporter, partial [Oceanithermus sp.]|nr:MFS transporter [Oceanithermus sp.]